MKQEIFVVLFQHRRPLLSATLKKLCLFYASRVHCVRVRYAISDYAVPSFLSSLSFIFGSFAVRFQCKFATETMRKLVYTNYQKIKKDIRL